MYQQVEEANVGAQLVQMVAAAWADFSSILRQGTMRMLRMTGGEYAGSAPATRRSYDGTWEFSARSCRRVLIALMLSRYRKPRIQILMAYSAMECYVYPIARGSMLR